MRGCVDLLLLTRVSRLLLPSVMKYLQVGACRALVGQVEEGDPRPALLLHLVDGLDSLVDAPLDLDGVDPGLPQARGHHLQTKRL